MLVSQTCLVRDRSKPEIGIILSQERTVLCPRCKHSIRFIDTLCDEIVNKNSDVRLVSLQDERILSGNLKMGIHTCNQTLGCRLLISGRSVDLTCKIKVLDVLQFKRRLELSRIEIVIFDSICRTENLCIFKTLDIMQSFHLDVQWKGRREALKIILIRSPTLRLKEELVLSLVRKSSELILDARTIARSDTFDHS